jgi:hypothetical protein
MSKVLVKSINDRPRVCRAKESDGFLSFNFKGKDYAVKPKDIYFTLSRGKVKFLNFEWIPTVNLDKVG